ncbi:MAG: HdeD family acid-resistance protein [Pirellulaceae bacterium]|nr:HdeD family acid-resistance protein [Pirellulaceae bacterium]
MSGESQSGSTNIQSTGQNSSLRDTWGWFMVLGIGLVVLGALAMVLPGLATFGVAITLGWLLVVGGALHGVHAFYVRNWSGFLLQGVMAFMYLMIGFLVLANPVESVFLLTLIVAVFFLFEGAMKVFLSFQVRPAQNWAWLLVSGILAFVLSGIILAGWPGDSIWVIGLLVGINILFSGCATIMLAMGAKGSSDLWCRDRNVTPSV